ncbi:MAG: insulinase family protein [Bacteroidales bacterium]|nr:insulinase family protein [Bacteroidales bacterium]
MTNYTQYQSVTLDNGLRIVHRSSDSPVMYCGFMVDCGTRDEDVPELYGMAHFVEHVLFKGTTTRDSWHINNRMESVGGELNAFTTKEETTFYAIGLNKDFDRATDLLCDMICNPTVPQHELETEREVVIDEIMSYRDTPAELIFDEFENRLFSTSSSQQSWCALGHNILGNEKTVRTFDHVKSLRFIEENYTPDRMVFFHQGATSFDKVVRLVEKYFRCSRAPKGEKDAGQTYDRVKSYRASLIANDTEQPKPIVIDLDTHQSHVLLGVPTYPIGHEHAAALALLCNILGGPGLTSRLGLELREHRGLVYTVESNINNFTDAGYLGIYFGCDHRDVNRCLRVCSRQIERFKNELLSPRQISNAQKQLGGQLGVAMANLENNAIALAKNLLRLGRVETLEQTCNRINSVTPELLKKVAIEIFDERFLKTVIIQ